MPSRARAAVEASGGRRRRGPGANSCGWFLLVLVLLVVFGWRRGRRRLHIAQRIRTAFTEDLLPLGFERDARPRQPDPFEIEVQSRKTDLVGLRQERQRVEVQRALVDKVAMER